MNDLEIVREKLINVSTLYSKRVNMVLPEGIECCFGCFIDEKHKITTTVFCESAFKITSTVDGPVRGYNSELDVTIVSEQMLRTIVETLSSFTVLVLESYVAFGPELFDFVTQNEEQEKEPSIALDDDVWGELGDIL